MTVLIKFKKLNQVCIRNIMREKLKYNLNQMEMDTCRDNFLFSGDDFIRRVGADCSGILSLEMEVHRLAREIGEEYSFIKEEVVEYDALTDRFIISVKGEADRFGSYGTCFYGGFIDETFGLLEEKRNALLEAMKRTQRIPKTFDVYSGYSKDGRFRTVVHWEDGVKTSVYLSNEDDDSFGHDLYLAIAYCYVKRKFGTMSHFKRIVERNTKDVTGGVKRFIYGGDSTLLVNVMLYRLYSIYDQVALYLAISYLGDTDQWLTEEDIKRLEDSINE